MSKPVMELRAKFDPGNIAATKAVAAKITMDYAMGALQQHLMGNWGLVNEDSLTANNRALKNDPREGCFFSVYPLENDPGEFWIMTEGEGEDRITTILLPEDY